MYKRIVRKDGSVILLVPRKESKSTTFEIMFKVGSRQELKRMNGSSHFIEHLMFKGTRKRPTTKHISKELDAIGAEYNAFTGKDHTGYYVQADMAHLPLSIDMLSDMLHHSKFDPKEVERERGVIVEELNMYRDNPMMRIDEIFESCIFAGSPLGWEIGGPREVIKSVRRNDLVAFMKKNYYSGNMVLGISGNFDEAKAIGLLNKYFPIRTKRAKATVKPFHFKQSKARIMLEYKDTDQVQLMLGFPGLSHKHSGSDALSLLSVIMGGNMSSRLFISIRERKGLAYVVRAMSESFEDTGYFAVRAGLDKARIYPALKAIKEELVRVAKHGVTTEEMRRAKDNIKGRLILKFEESSSYLSFLMSQELLTPRVDSLDKALARLEAVSKESVNRIARTLIRWDKANIGLIGPFKDKQPFLDILKKRV